MIRRPRALNLICILDPIPRKKSDFVREALARARRWLEFFCFMLIPGAITRERRKQRPRGDYPRAERKWVVEMNSSSWYRRSRNNNHRISVSDLGELSWARNTCGDFWWSFTECVFLSCCAHQLPTLKAYSPIVQLKNTWPHAISTVAARTHTHPRFFSAPLKSILIGTNSLTLWLNYCSALAIWFSCGRAAFAALYWENDTFKTAFLLLALPNSFFPCFYREFGCCDTIWRKSFACCFGLLDC